MHSAVNPRPALVTSRANPIAALFPPGELALHSAAIFPGYSTGARRSDPPAPRREHL